MSNSSTTSKLAAVWREPYTPHQGPAAEAAEPRRAHRLPGVRETAVRARDGEAPHVPVVLACTSAAGGEHMTQRKSPRPGKPEANSNADAAVNTTPQTDSRPGSALQWVPCTRQYPQDVASQLRRRGRAGRRLPQWYPEPPLTDHQIDGWRAAIQRTMPIGPCLVPIEVLQRLYRNGGSDRELAMRVWAETGGLVA